jgi:hypothetical protein
MRNIGLGKIDRLLRRENRRAERPNSIPIEL